MNEKVKKIIVLSDGTGNGAAKRHKTNVWRLYNALDLHCGNQIAKYDDGVGAGEFFLIKLLAGIGGYGLKRNVIELYKFLCRNYDCGRKNKIYLFGFSRGAFTVRLLAGLVECCGLCTEFASEQELHKIARENYAIYHQERYKRCCSLYWLLRWLKRCLLKLCRKQKCRAHSGSAVQPEFEFVGAWDTVEAYGLPVGFLNCLWDLLVYPVRFRDRKLAECVKKGCHALSVDDERPTFHPVLWDESNEDDKKSRIEQVWFPGSHSDVGGGYPSSELALVSLDWMISKVEEHNEDCIDPLKFREDQRNKYREYGDWNGIRHDSRAGGLGFLYRYSPRNIGALCRKAKTARENTPPKVHRSVFERIQSKVDEYVPTGIPEKYTMVQTRCANQEYETGPQAAERQSKMKPVLRVIRWRKCVYWMFVLYSTFLFAVLFCLVYLYIGTCSADSCCEAATIFKVDCVFIFLDRLCNLIGMKIGMKILMSILLLLLPLLSYLKCCLAHKTFYRAASAWSHLRKSQETCPDLI